MEIHSQKILTQTILNIIHDIRDCYVKKYGNPIGKWDKNQFHLYLINCDLEIKDFFKKNKFIPHPDSTNFGVSYGVCVLEQIIYNSYNREYGELITYAQKEMFHDELTDTIYVFLSNGLGDEK